LIYSVKGCEAILLIGRRWQICLTPLLRWIGKTLFKNKINNDTASAPSKQPKETPNQPTYLGSGGPLPNFVSRVEESLLITLALAFFAADDSSPLLAIHRSFVG